MRDTVIQSNAYVLVKLSLNRAQNRAIHQLQRGNGQGNAIYGIQQSPTSTAIDMHGIQSILIECAALYRICTWTSQYNRGYGVLNNSQALEI